MAIRVGHELHQRRKSRNIGVFVVLLAFVGLVFGLTMVKVQQLGDTRAFEGYDHVMQPALVNLAEDEAAAAAAAEADAAVPSNDEAGVDEAAQEPVVQ